VAKESVSGMKAGAFAGVFFMAAAFVIDFVRHTSSWFELPAYTSEQLNLPFESTALLLFLSFLIVFAVSGLVGMISGFVFAKLMSVLPSRSLYLKGITYGLCLSLLVCLVSRWSILQAITALAVGTFDAFVFSFLFQRWTKHAQAYLSSKPDSATSVTHL
jgi:hypothetical protein